MRTFRKVRAISRTVTGFAADTVATIADQILIHAGHASVGKTVTREASFADKTEVGDKNEKAGKTEVIPANCIPCVNATIRRGDKITVLNVTS